MGWNPSVNSRPGCSHIALQTQVLKCANRQLPRKLGGLSFCPLVTACPEGKTGPGVGEWIWPRSAPDGWALTVRTAVQNEERGGGARGCRRRCPHWGSGAESPRASGSKRTAAVVRPSRKTDTGPVLVRAAGDALQFCEVIFWTFRQRLMKVRIARSQGAGQLGRACGMLHPEVHPGSERGDHH